MAGMTKHGCRDSPALFQGWFLEVGWICMGWRVAAHKMIIYVAESYIRNHCGKVKWFAGVQHPISLLGRDAWREDASCLFLGGDGWYPAPNQMIGVGRAQSQSTTIIKSTHQPQISYYIIVDYPLCIIKCFKVEWRSFRQETAGHLTLLPPVATRGGPVTGTASDGSRETFSKDWWIKSYHRLPRFSSILDWDLMIWPPFLETPI